MYSLKKRQTWRPIRPWAAHTVAWAAHTTAGGPYSCWAAHTAAGVAVLVQETTKLSKKCGKILSLKSVLFYAQGKL